MELFIKLTIDERNVIQNALRVYADYIADLINARQEGPNGVDELLKNAQKDTDALCIAFSKL